MLTRLPVSAASLHLIRCHHHVRRPIVRVVVLQAGRTYATPGRPKSVVGETSKAVKRTTSRAQGASTSSKATAARTKSSKSTVKKPAAKKATSKKAASHKKKPVKKALTEEQKAAQQEKKLKRKASDKKKADQENIRALKQQALKPPVPPGGGGATSFTAYMADAIKSSAAADKPLVDRFAEAAKRYSTLSASEKETWKKRALEARAERSTQLKKWIESHTAAEIGNANKARARLNRIYPVDLGKRAKYPLFEDERLPKRALSVWSVFVGERIASSEFANVPLGERTVKLAEEFRQLSPEKRKDVERKAAASRSAYEKSYVEVYGKAPLPVQVSKPKAVKA